LIKERCLFLAFGISESQEHCLFSPSLIFER